MYYPGDTVSFYISLATATGSPGTITTPPQISVLSAANDLVLSIAGAGVTSAAMNLVAGTASLYKFNWNTGAVAPGTYVAVVSYIANGNTVNGLFLQEVQVGDSCVTGPVALASITAKTTDLPDKTTVMLTSQFVAPQNDPSVQAILTGIQSLPAGGVASQLSLSQVSASVQDMHDYELGSWTIDKTVVPNVLTCYRLDGTALQSFQLIQNTNSSNRSRS